MNAVWILAIIKMEGNHLVNVATSIRKIRMPPALAVRVVNLKMKINVAPVVMNVTKNVQRTVMIAEIVSVAQKNVKNAVWLVGTGWATVFYFFFAVDYVAELIDIDIVVMNATNAALNAVANQVKTSQFFLY